MYLSMLRVAKSRRLLRVRPGVEIYHIFNEDSAMRHRQELTISNVCNGLPRDYRRQLFASFATSSRSFASQTNDTSGKPDAKQEEESQTINVPNQRHKEREPSPPPGAGGGGWFPWLSDIDDETKVCVLYFSTEIVQDNTSQYHTKTRKKQGNEKPRQDNTKTGR
jgi:hypothetical protein